jgi:3-methyladenine DNA glycosylase AlkD
MDEALKSPTYSEAKRALRRHANAKKAVTYRGFFKNAEKDIFLGVSAPLMKQIAKDFWELPLADVRRLMASRVHDERSLANSVLVLKYQIGDEKTKHQIFDFYLKNRRFIRNWDGVDDSAPYIVGPHLLDKSRAVLFKLAGSKSLWDRRIAMVSTWWFIRKGDTGDSFKLAEKLLKDREDLMHKAVGWMLREAGKRDLPSLKRFLARHGGAMPRTMLRYAIEKFPESERKKYLLKGAGKNLFHRQDAKTPRTAKE